MIGKSTVEVLREVTGDNSIETVAEGLEAALGGGGSGGGGALVVKASGVYTQNLQPTTGSGEDITLDKTFSEIEEVILSGGDVVIDVPATNVPDTSIYDKFHLTRVTAPEDGSSVSSAVFTFVYIDIYQSKASFYKYDIVVTSSGSKIKKAEDVS